MPSLPRPRWIILGLLLAAGLGLRLWGINWGRLQGAVALHPGEWVWQIIDSLSWSAPSYQGIWTQVFFTLAAFLMGVVNTVAGWMADWLGHPNGEVVVLSARMAGRLTVALMGTAQIWLAYLVAHRAFDSVGAGLLAAAMIAINPLLVAHGHFLALDTPLALMVLLCLLALLRLLESPTSGRWALAGLVLGLTITTKASGLVMAPILALAYLQCWRTARPAKSRLLVLWPLSLIGGLLAGLALGYPDFLLGAPEAGRVLTSSVSWPPAPGGDWSGFLRQRALEWVAAVHQGLGWEVPALWLLGLLTLAFGQHRKRLILALFPLLYLPASLALLTGSVEGLQAVWAPAALVVAPWPLIVICRRMPGRWPPVMLAAALGVLVCALPLWRSLAVGQLFWQPESRSLARTWLEDNLDGGEKVLLGSGYLLGVSRPARPLEQAKDWSALRKLGGYAVMTLPSASNPAPEAGEGLEINAGRMLGKMQLLADFQLKPGPPDPARFPRWLSPVVRIFSTLEHRDIGLRLAMSRPPVGVDRPYALLMTRPAVYGKEAAVMRLDRAARAARVLRNNSTPGPIGLHLSNQGQDLARLVVRQGWLASHRLTIYPGQEQDLMLRPRAWPPTLAGYFPVSLELVAGRGLVAGLEWDPLLLAKRAMRKGRYHEAIELLRGAITHDKGGFDAQVLLAGALARSGDLTGAESVVLSLGDEHRGPLTAYRALAIDQEQGQEWDQRFGRMTGYHPDLLRKALSHRYLLSGPLILTGRNQVTIRGKGFHGAFRKKDQSSSGLLRLWLEDLFPRGPWRAEFLLEVKGEHKAKQEVGRVELWAHHAKGSVMLGSQAIDGSEVQDGNCRVVIEAVSPQAWAEAEVRIITDGDNEAWPREVRLGMGIQGHMRAMLRWYDEARGRVALQAGRAAEAASAFESLLKLDPASPEVYLPLARALLESGKKERALEMIARSEEIFQSIPPKLQEVLKLYKTMGLAKEAERVEKRLAHLHPSMGSTAGFACGMTLLGYDLPVTEVARGSKLTVHYYWRADTPPPVNYAVFVHLKGNGRRYSFDHYLDHNQQAMDDLRPGQVVREDYEIAISPEVPPGRYTLVVGLWDARFTGVRVPITSGADAGKDEVLLGFIDVK